MNAVRLDPADPFASVLAWLAALARALGLDPAQRAPRTPPTREVAAAVRAVLADWSLQLRALVWAKALRLAMRLPRPPARNPGPPPDLLPKGLGASDNGRPVAARLDLLGPGSRFQRVREADQSEPAVSVEAKPRAAPAARPAPDAPLDPAAAAALKARTRAVYLALLDPGVLIRRLAQRLARAGACPEPARFPRPPRATGPAPRGLVRKPELRPPKCPAAVRPAARPAAPAAASPALAFSSPARGGGGGAKRRRRGTSPSVLLRSTAPRTRGSKGLRAAPAFEVAAALRER